MRGTFTGVGVGPGDPGLMTVKAVRAVMECDVIAIPVSDSTLKEPVYEQAQKARQDAADGASGVCGRCREYLEKCVAYGIAVRACPEAGKKDHIFLPMPMIKEKDRLREIHDCDAEAVAKLLDQGADVVFLTLGDPTIYSTCMYVHKRLKRRGYGTQIIPGIPSFCAAAARLDIPLAENRQEIHILPASYHIEDSLELPGTKVLMKAGRKMDEVKNLLLKKEVDAVMVENCGMENEKLYFGAREIPEQAGYYSLLIVKETREDGNKSVSDSQRGGTEG